MATPTSPTSSRLDDFRTAPRATPEPTGSLEPDAVARSLSEARPRRAHEPGVVGSPLADGTQRIGPATPALPELWDGSADLDRELAPIAPQNRLGIGLFFSLCGILVAVLAMFGLYMAWAH